MLKIMWNNLSYQTILIKRNKNVKCASYKYVIINICKQIFVTFGRIWTRSQSYGFLIYNYNASVVVGQSVF
jgi:hypothetical protein